MARIQPLAWERPYATGAALKSNFKKGSKILSLFSLGNRVTSHIVKNTTQPPQVSRQRPPLSKKASSTAPISIHLFIISYWRRCCSFWTGARPCDAALSRHLFLTLSHYHLLFSSRGSHVPARRYIPYSSVCFLSAPPLPLAWKFQEGRNLFCSLLCFQCSEQFPKQSGK